VDSTSDKSGFRVDSMLVHGGEIGASVAHADSLVTKGKSAAALSSLGTELVDLVDTVLLGDSADSHLTGLGARDKLVRSDSVVGGTRLFLRGAEFRALVGGLELGDGFPGLDGTSDMSGSSLDSMLVHGGEIGASVAHADSLVTEGKGAAALSSLGTELLDLGIACVLGNTIDSHDTSLSARDKLVRSDFVVSRARLFLGSAHVVALAFFGESNGSGNYGMLSTCERLVSARGLGNAVGSLFTHVSTARVVERFTSTSTLSSVIVLVEDTVCTLGASLFNGSRFTTSVSTSLSTDFTATPGISSVVASSGVIGLFLGVESLLSECSTSDKGESLSFSALILSLDFGFTSELLLESLSFSSSDLGIFSSLDLECMSSSKFKLMGFDSGILSILNSLGVCSFYSGEVGMVVNNIQLAGNDQVQLGAPVSDVGVAVTTPLETVMVTTGKVSSVVTLASEITSSTPKAVLVVVGHALDFSGGGTSHGSTESFVTFPGGGFLVVDVSSASLFDGRLAGAVLDNSTDGIAESFVVTVRPSSGVSVRIFAIVSVSDFTVAVALTSSSTSVFFTTMLVSEFFPVFVIGNGSGGGLGELGGTHGSSNADDSSHSGRLDKHLFLFK